MPATTQLERIPAARTKQARPGRLGAGWGIPLLVGVLALAIRLFVVLRGGGLYGYLGYDDGVYFAAAAALVSGRLPYQDFILLHPPGIALLLAPFAAVGRLTSDSDAMAVARVAFLVLAGVIAGLTARVASVLGRRAALTAGGFVAVWVCAVYGDRTTLLEPVGSLALLTALLLLWPPHGRRRLTEPHAQLLAGAVLGLGCCVKVWNGVPFAVVAAAVLVTQGRQAAVRLVLASVASGLAVLGPFLVGAPRAAIRMVFLDQLSRPDIGSSPLERLPRLIGVLPYLSEDHAVAVIAVTLVVGVVLATLTVHALAAREARLWVALLVAHGLVLLAAPIYLNHYSTFLTVPLALTLGASAAVVSDRLRNRGSRTVERLAAATAVTTLVILGLGSLARPLGEQFPGERLAAHLPASGCVRSDVPTALIQLDVLSRDLSRGCSIPVDFTGQTYDRLARQGLNGSPLPRDANPAWQAYVREYLTSGSATVLVRGSSNGFDETTQQLFGSLPVLGRVGLHAVLGPLAAAGR
jgi:alpha-1,2-mannosyltransferase